MADELADIRKRIAAAELDDLNTLEEVEGEEEIGRGKYVISVERKKVRRDKNGRIVAVIAKDSGTFFTRDEDGLISGFTVIEETEED
jgi:hypothetical protein